MARRPAWSMTFANDGGPLLVLPRELLGDWKGGEGKATPKDTDYARACQAEHPAALVKVGTGFGLVIGSQDPICTANWLRLPERIGAALIGWSYADDGSKAKAAELLRTDSLQWRCQRATIHLSNGDLVLIHAACPGESVRELDAFGEGYAVIGDGIPFRLEPGDYALDTVEIGGDLGHDLFGCVICRWIPLGETS